jgi:type 1 glutamine amidotransferase
LYFLNGKESYMMIMEKSMTRTVALVGFLLMVLVCYGCSGDFLQREDGSCDGKIKAVVLTGGHGFKKKEFLESLDGYDDIEYVHAPQSGQSEIFEDISGWDYDVIVFYSMKQEISAKRQRNFIKLMEKGVGVLVLHHAVAEFPDWPEYRKILGAKYYLKETKEGDKVYQRCVAKHGVRIMVNVTDEQHPITEGISDFEIIDETYKGHNFEKDNQILLSTENPGNEKPLCWVRRYSNSNVCYFQPGHGPKAYSNKNYLRLVGRAIRWCAGELEK